MTATRNRKTETLVYTGLWLIAVGIYLLSVMRNRAQMSLPLLDAGVLTSTARLILPFFVLFVLNNALLIPRLLLRNRLWAYFAATALAVALLWAYQ